MLNITIALIANRFCFCNIRETIAHHISIKLTKSAIAQATFSLLLDAIALLLDVIVTLLNSIVRLLDAIGVLLRKIVRLLDVIATLLNNIVVFIIKSYANLNNR